MANSLPQSVYNSLLLTDKLSLENQEIIFDYGVRNKDNVVLVSLAQYKDLAPEIDAKIAELPAAKVKAAWVSRQGRSSQEVEAMIKKERRQSVLLALAEFDNLTEESYKFIAKRGNEKVAAVIINNPQVPKESRELAAQIIAKSVTSYTKVATYSVLGSASDLHDVVLMNTTDLNLVSYIADSVVELEEATQARVVDSVLIPTLSRDISSGSSYRYSNHITPVVTAIRITEKLANAGVLTPDSITKLKQAFAALNLSALEGGYGGGNKAHRIAALSALENPTPYGQSSTSLLAAQLSSEELERTIPTLKTRSHFLTFLNHPSCTVEQFRTVLTTANYQQVNWHDKSQLVKDNQKNLEKLAVVLANTLHFATAKTFYKTSDPKRAFALFLDEIVKSMNTTNRRMSVIPEWILGSSLMDDVLIRKLPVNLLDFETLPGQSVAIINELLLQEFGTDKEYWHAFETTSQNFAGNLDELLIFCKLI